MTDHELLELAAKLVEALEKNHQWHQAYDEYDGYADSLLEKTNSTTLAKARAYLETGGWTKVEDGLPVVPDGDYDVEIWIVFPSGIVARWLWLDVDTEFDAGITHWRYAEPTQEPPKG